MKQLAIMHKETGNQCLKSGFVDEAIMHYTKSIVSSYYLLMFITDITCLLYQNYDQTNPIVYTNRATAFKKHKEFELMMSDS